MPDITEDSWADLLERAIGAPPGGPRPDAVIAAGHRAVRRRQVATGAGAAVAIVAVVGLTIALRPGSSGQTGAPYAAEPTSTASAPPPPTATPPVTAVVTPQGADQVVVGPRYATWGPDGLVATHGAKILGQRAHVTFARFAGPGVRTAAARVRAADGTIWYVVAREQGDPQLINVADSAQWTSLDQFISWAQAKYRSGEGLL
ncbi:hypothetical protein GCM10009798_02260 [Nocardioides panacihumi]|uniref:Serine/threonine protein kinase n=1 Tax=Nocardioides panacihumi TaxID=400774 RepID=A0ABP5BMP5_9ACTN